MNVLHLTVSGGIGGIETLLRDYHLYSKHNNYFVFAWDGGVIADEMISNGANVTVFNNKNKFCIALKVLELVKEQNIGIIVVHNSSPFLRILGLIIKLIYKKKVLIQYAHAAAVDMYTCPSKIKKLYRKLAQIIGFKQADEIIAISAYVKKSIVSLFGVSELKAKIIYNGINTEPFSGEISNSRKICFVGRLVKEKGVQNVIEIMKYLPQEYSLEIIGDGDYRKELEKQAAGMSDRILFLGSRRDVPQLLKEVDYFIHLPEWEEGFGITVIEAMASGKICVVAKSGALPEIIEDGVNGYLVNRHDYKEIASKIMQLDKDQDAKMAISVAAKNRAKDFSIEKYSEALDCLLYESINREELQIFIATHGPKCIHNRYTDFCTPIEVGADERDSFRYEIKDNTGDNISGKHPNYAEVTALYWIWKNAAAKYVGLYHYRRYFPLIKGEILKILGEYDFIVPSCRNIDLELHYKSGHLGEDWDLMMDAIKELYPEDYPKVLAKKNDSKFYYGNLFIAKRKTFCAYCEWLFPILQYVEERCDRSKHTGYQTRWAGFMAERLFALYLAIHNDKLYCSEVRRHKMISRKNSLIENIYYTVRDNHALYKIARCMPEAWFRTLKEKLESEKRKRRGQL